MCMMPPGRAFALRKSQPQILASLQASSLPDPTGGIASLARVVREMFPSIRTPIHGQTGDALVGGPNAAMEFQV